MSKKPVKAAKQTAAEIKQAAEKVLFLDKLSRGYTVTGAARAIKVSRQCAYKWRDTDPDFRQAWADAEVEGIHTLEDEAVRRAVDGVAEPIIQNGEVVGEKLKYSDSLLMFLLKAKDRETYGDQSKVDLSGHVATGQMTDDQLNAEIARLAAADVAGAAAKE